MNWKFWTWPRQIRELKAALKLAREEVARLKRENQRHVNKPQHRTQHL
jgi:hypothetical protein